MLRTSNSQRRGFYRTAQQLFIEQHPHCAAAMVEKKVLSQWEAYWNQRPLAPWLSAVILSEQIERKVIEERSEIFNRDRRVDQRIAGLPFDMLRAYIAQTEARFFHLGRYKNEAISVLQDCLAGVTCNSFSSYQEQAVCIIDQLDTETDTLLRYPDSLLGDLIAALQYIYICYQSSTAITATEVVPTAPQPLSDITSASACDVPLLPKPHPDWNLHVAAYAENGWDELVLAYIRPEERDEFSWPALSSYLLLLYAKRLGGGEMVKSLLAVGCNPNTHDDLGFTPLHISAQCGNLRAAIALIAKSADVNYISRNGSTPLKLALQGRCLDMIALLLFVGSEITRSSAAKELCSSYWCTELDEAKLTKAKDLMGLGTNRFSVGRIKCFLGSRTDYREDIASVLVDSKEAATGSVRLCGAAP